MLMAAMQTNQGVCEMCGHYTMLRQKAHIGPKTDKGADNLLKLCPSCHVVFDHHLKPRLFKALERAGATNLPAMWKTSHYQQAGEASMRARGIKAK